MSDIDTLLAAGFSRDEVVSHLSSAGFSPDEIASSIGSLGKPVNAEGNTYEEAMYGSAAPAGMKLASGALSGIASMADLPELLGGLAYKYNPMSPGFLQETPQEKFQKFTKSIIDSGEINNLTPEQVSELERMEKVINEPVLGLGDKVRSGFDYLTGIENSTQVDPDSLLHLIGSYIPYTAGGGTLLSGGAKNIAKTALQKVANPVLLGTGGYVGREVGGGIGSAVGGDEGEKYGQIGGEIVGNIFAGMAPRTIKNIANREVDTIENLLLGNDKGKAAKIIGGLDKEGNFTTKAKDIVTQVTKKDLLAKDLKDSGFWDHINPTDGPTDVAKKLAVFRESSAEVLTGLVDDAARTEAALADDITKVSFKSSRQYIKEIARSKPKLAERLAAELDDFSTRYYTGETTISELNKFRQSWGETTKATYNPAKTAEDKVIDTFNKSVYSDLRTSIDKRAAQLGALKGDLKMADDLKAANRAYHASSSLENQAAQVSRSGVRGRLNKDALDSKNLIRMAGLAGASTLGAPGAATYAALDFARAAARDALPVQTRAALRGVGAVADIFDPLSMLAKGGVAGNKLVGEGKYIPLLKKPNGGSVPPVGSAPVDIFAPQASVQNAPIFSAKAATSAEAPSAKIAKVKAPTKKELIARDVQKSVDELKQEFDPEVFAFEKELPLDSENAWRDIEFQDGKYQSMLIRDNKDVVTKRVAWADRRPGYQANTQRVAALEALTKISRNSKVDKTMASGKLFTPEMRDALIRVESSEGGLSFRSESGKKFMPADEATKEFMDSFNIKLMSPDQLRATAIGVRTPIKVNGVNVSPYKAPEMPDDLTKFFDEAPLPENPEGGMAKGGALAGLATAGAIGMSMMNGGTLNEVALTPENKASERLITAMISQESGGNKKAVSPKGASGLMQLMPATAKEVARELGLKNPDIFNPEINKKLGTHYINKMLKIFKNDPKLALAAYNAGPGNVRRWIAKWGMDWDKISENLEKRGQYMETVKYVPSIIKKMGVK